MLWKKETKNYDSMYVDIFALNGGEASLEKAIRNLQCHEKESVLAKNDTQSFQKRQAGNEYFSQGKWVHAITLYNESLLFAENSSKNISLAYANRSACFLKLKKYNECLVDIELAKEARYPSELMPKLDRRKEDCLKQMKNDVPSKLETKMTFEPHKHFPWMANVLKIDRDADGGLAIFATEDIDVGENIMAEKSFMCFLYRHYGSKCNICLKSLVNLMPCEKCTIVMFCSECKDNPLHPYECGLKSCIRSQTNGQIMRLVRSCLLGIDHFSSADELMNFAEQSIKGDLHEIPTTSLDAKWKYEAFLKLPIDNNNGVNDDVAVIVFKVYKMLLNITKIGSMFQSVKRRRFLMHLILQHYHILELNSAIGTYLPKMDHTENNCYCTQTELYSQYFRHSCAPNVLKVYVHDMFMITTIRPIKKGAKLLKSIYIEDFLSAPKATRQKNLWQGRKIFCTCERCISNKMATSAQRRRMTLDPDYLYIVDYDESIRIDKFMPTAIDKCKSFLQKYGEIRFCKELGVIVEVYQLFMNTLSTNQHLLH
ncbi:uncharacterized protein LOC116346765 [Contarinia nasturtii]|uniref:uncharacterized protein LOC116346765 n=1 Tax=Contarinia nasturtii TaxID=265458 RepID=UPI0012D4A8FE|nr:uncharacterized protein LOC116346765 [Contarinia nasturtii]